MEELLIGKQNSPCSQFQTEYNLQTNCLLQQSITETLTQQEKKSTKTSPNIFPFSHSNDTGTSWHTAFRRQALTANLTTKQTLQKAREITKLLSIFHFLLLYYTLHISRNIVLHYWNIKLHASWAQENIRIILHKIHCIRENSLYLRRNEVYTSFKYSTKTAALV